MSPDSPNKKFRIGEILVNHGYITEEELQQALAHQKGTTQTEAPLAEGLPPSHIPLGQICVNLGFISSVELSKVLRKHCKRIYLGELLVNLGIIDGEQLDQMLQKQKEEKKRLGELLLESGYLTEEQLARSLSMQLGFPFIVPNIQLIDQKLALRFHEAFLRRQEAIPAFEKEGIVTLIMADPLADDIVDDFKKSLNAEIEPAIATRSAIHSLLDALSHKIEYGLKSDDALAGKDLVIGNELYTKDARGGSHSGDNTVNIVNYIISSAITEGASDIHIEPQSYNLRIRFRIDGVLQHKTDLPKRMSPSIISRIKVMCGMDIAEHRRHQDGRIEARVLDNDIDLRVSAYSAVYGENIVIRVLKRQTALIDLDKLGLSPLNLKRYIRVLDTPTGIVLICGPTGSGKTTTLYASLNYLNQLAKKIITVEDPVEYTIEGVVQGQFNPKAGLSYSNYIASMMRQDPDVIMVGEIRDTVAAAATIQAALTGHKALSTFHTDDSTGALLRLMDMGIETFLISSTVVSVIAQRLVRRVCTNCKESYEPDLLLFQSLGIKNVDTSKYSFSRGRGCSLCHQTGYRGRIGIQELLVVNEDIRDAILNRKISSEIRQIARTSAHMISMREDGFYKAAQGVTNLEEILRVIFYSDAEVALLRDADEIIRHINGEEIIFTEQTPVPRINDRKELGVSNSVLQIDEVSNPQPSNPQTLNPATHNPDPTLNPQPATRNLVEEMYRIRFEVDTLSLEQDRIRDFFRKYQSLKSVFGEDVSDDLLADFIDFILYHTNLAQRKYGAIFVEFSLKMIEGKGPKIFLQFQSCKLTQSSSSSSVSSSVSSSYHSHLERARGKRLMEFLA